jgi:hypothetical protein
MLAIDLKLELLTSSRSLYDAIIIKAEDED